MSKPYRIVNAVWVTEDGSYGTGLIAYLPVEYEELISNADTEEISNESDSDRLDFFVRLLKRRWRSFRRVERAIKILEQSGNVSIKRYRLTDDGVEDITDPE